MSTLEIGSDIPFEFNLESEQTPGTYENLDNLALLEIWIWTAKDNVKKFNKTGSTGFTALRKIDEFNYSADLTSQLNSDMRSGQAYLKVIFQRTDATFADGNYRNQKTFPLDLMLVR